MYELIAIGPESQQRWRHALPPDEVIRLGRSPQNGWSVPWDMRISREHADLLLSGSQLHVRCLESARNAIHGRSGRTRDAVVDSHGEFRIGMTTFRLQPTDPRGAFGGDPIAPSDCIQRGVGELPRPASEELAEQSKAWNDSSHPSGSPSPSGVSDSRNGLSNSQLGGYLLVDRVHRSPRADVYMARHGYLDCWAAVQIRQISGPSDNEAVMRLRQKARLLAWLKHTGLPICRDAGECHEVAFLAMEWVDGKPLTDGLGESGFPLDRVISLTRKTADALAYVHRQGVVHRDLNPSHLLVDQQGTLKIVGWNSALQLGDDSLEAFEQQGQPVGDLDFAAPEQIEDSRRVDIRADIYGLGCTLFTLLTGKALFVNPDAWEKAKKHRFEPPPLLRESRPEVPLGLEELYLRMVAKAPEGRPADMSQVVSALESL